MMNETEEGAFSFSQGELVKWKIYSCRSKVRTSWELARTFGGFIDSGTQRDLSVCIRAQEGKIASIFYHSQSVPSG